MMRVQMNIFPLSAILIDISKKGDVNDAGKQKLNTLFTV